MIVDASALVAMAVEEPESVAFATCVEQSAMALTHPVSVYEAALAIARISRLDVDEARDALSALLRASSITVLELGPAESTAALDAFARFGKGRHRAALNMGDCFSYACARLRGMPLLFKGDDFTRTDITAA